MSLRRPIVLVSLIAVLAACSRGSPASSEPPPPGDVPAAAGAKASSPALGEPVDLAAQLGHSLRESSRALLGMGRGALLLLAVLAPWLPLLAAAAYLGRRVLRRS